MTPNVPCPLGRGLGAHLARFAEAELAKHPGHPERCGSCAFRPGTRPNGCLTTMGDALKCLLEGDVFLCHEDAAEGHERPCRGWAMLDAAKSDEAGRFEVPWPYSDEG